MTTTLTRSGHARPHGEGLRLAGRRRSRRPASAVGSLALVLACATIFTSLYLRADRQVAVLVVAHDVSLGRQITGADLAEVEVSPSAGLSLIPANEAKIVVGKRTRVTLFAGTLLVPAELAARNGLRPGQDVVGIAVKPGELPATGVAPGDVVDVLVTAPPGVGASAIGDASSLATGGSTGAIGTVAQHVVVASVAAPTAASSDVTVVSVVVASSLAAEVANVSAAGQAAIALVGPGT